MKSVVIVFMTDGQDNGSAKSNNNSVGSSKSDSLVRELRGILAMWGGDVVVHTVGFSAGHDFEFLNALRKVGHDPEKKLRIGQELRTRTIKNKNSRFCCTLTLSFELWLSF